MKSLARRTLAPTFDETRIEAFAEETLGSYDGSLRTIWKALCHEHVLLSIPMRYDPLKPRVVRWFVIGFLTHVLLAELAFALVISSPDPGCSNQEAREPCEALEYNLDASRACGWDEGSGECCASPTASSR
ncbi:hypothetical protein SO694_00039145 [Aureococcus anophagefferens]|uniref:Uncharacterized protein n=1 Tax=Aureococcus anophagefferens TaxID=44056 RepID=A0ABR1FLI8_AURAN